ncbi:hypothetical protein QTI33_23760 [Variovorax sp. J22P271]|uniref:hypothetical protein n=1 Tax=Variovorax davisae TaxID=3053515 RepID=UPI00257778DA|nr:hypothetical protein [Variovorax sp. J22P271]MDM0035172.1 hypothetical protein [Variovorax sp. J22P271]
MKQSFDDWESQWSSARRREQLATERQHLEQERYVAGWRRNLAVLAVMVVVLAVLLIRHFA